MIVRYVDVCPSCGKWMPWVVYRKINNPQPGEMARQYVKCRRCGATDVISYRLKSSLLPNTSNIPCRP